MTEVVEAGCHSLRSAMLELCKRALTQNLAVLVVLLMILLKVGVAFDARPHIFKPFVELLVVRNNTFDVAHPPLDVERLAVMSVASAFFWATDE